jgi:hypothetical protein
MTGGRLEHASVCYSIDIIPSDYGRRRRIADRRNSANIRMRVHLAMSLGTHLPFFTSTR